MSMLMYGEFPQQTEDYFFGGAVLLWVFKKRDLHVKWKHANILIKRDSCFSINFVS